MVYHAFLSKNISLPLVVLLSSSNAIETIVKSSTYVLTRRLVTDARNVVDSTTGMAGAR